MLPTLRLSRYEIHSLIGVGGMGKVYLATDTRLRRKVALKLLSPEFTADKERLLRFEQEAQTASALNHPNILTIYEIGEEESTFFIASEFIDGETLRSRIARGRVPVPSALMMASQIAGALVAAHGAGIVHRDIKPENVMLRSDDLVKLLDFGLAKLIESSGNRRALAEVTGTHLTVPGTILGTVDYMSPEQARGHEVDARSDIFSLGVVLYEMLSARAPFQGETNSDVLAQVLIKEPPLLSDLVPQVSRELELIVTKAIRKDRDTRYQSAKELLADINELRQEQEFQAQLRRRRPSSTTDTTTRDSDAAALTRLHVASGSEPVSDIAPASVSPSGIAPVRSRYTRLLLFSLLGLLIVAAGALAFRHFEHPAVATRPSAAADHPRSLAILPFHNVTGDPKIDFLGFSLADAVITKLGYVSSLVVRPSASISQYVGQEVALRKIAADLDVDSLLTGNFIKQGDRLRISLQLVDAKADTILWRDTIDANFQDLLSAQDKVSQEIVRGLELSLSAKEAQRLQPSEPLNANAYELYLRGIDSYAKGDLAMCIRLLKKSAELEPNYAPTWAALGKAYTTEASLQFGGRENYNQAEEAYRRALAIDPDQIEARIYEANLFTDTGRVEQAVPMLRAVLKTNPNYAEAHWELGYAYRFGGMLEQSVSEAEEARRLDPKVKLYTSAINSYLYLGQYDKFLSSLPETDSAAFILFYRGFGEYYKKDFAEASRLFDRAFDLEPSMLQAEIGKSISFAIAGKNADGLKLLRATAENFERQGVSDPEGLYKIAQAFAILDDKADALHELHHSIDGGFFCYPYLVADPIMGPLRGDPEFASLMKQARDRYQAFKGKFF